MLKKKLDEKQILLVLVCEDKPQFERQLKILRSVNLETPQGFTFSAYPVIGSKNLPASFNEVQKKNNAKYKIFITSPIVKIEKSFVIKTFEAFFIEPKTAMVGLLGSEMPISGDYTQAKNFYGLYTYKDANGEIQNYLGNDPLYYQSVHILENGFFATNQDIAWDEKIGNDFAVVAHCLNFRAKGYDVGVFYQESPMIIFERDECDYNLKPNTEDYNKQLEKFGTFYFKKFQPLVSILIPTYNQPEFCRQALESALVQTYKNTEILIGDDSTNEDTKKMIRPYLKKNSNLKYFYHDGKIPRGGGPNMHFILNRSNGEYINYLLHDDLFHPEKIFKMMNYFVQDLEGQIGLVTSARDLIDENNRFLFRRNPWQPHHDTIIKGEDVGRRLLFILANFIGELTTALFKKKSVRKSDGSFATGNFCDVYSASYGDMDTWLEILKGGDLVFMTESLSCFRKHAAQSTYNPNTRITLPLDALNFVTTAWLNNVFFRSDEEYHYCLDKWPIMADRWFTPIKDDDEEIIKKRKEWIIKLREIFVKGNYEKMTDAAISYLLEHVNGYSGIANLIRKNPRTFLWEKIIKSPLETKNLDVVSKNIWMPRGEVTKFNKALKCDVGGIFCSDITFGGADFTVDFWGYIDKSAKDWSTLFYATANPVPFSDYKGVLYLARFDKTDNLAVGIFDEEGKTLLEEDNNQLDFKAVGSLHHYELSYSHAEKIIRFFADGNLIFEKTGIEIKPIERFVGVGYNLFHPFGYSNVGTISEFRISDCVRHTENFTPQKENYSLDENTLSLIHFD